MDALHWWRQGDAVTQGTALLLLAMSVASWVVILWKARVMRRALADVARCTAAFWQAPSLDVAVQRLQSFDREALVLSMVVATKSIATRPNKIKSIGLVSSNSTYLITFTSYHVLCVLFIFVLRVFFMCLYYHARIWCASVFCLFLSQEHRYEKNDIPEGRDGCMGAV